MTTVELCSDYHFLEGIRVLKYIITVLKILIPLVLIILGSIDLSKAVIDPANSDIKKQSVVFTKRVASAAIIFLLPTIITITFSLIIDYSSFANLLTTCMNNATSENIAHLKEIANQRIEANKKVAVNYNITYEKSSYVMARARKNSANGLSSAGTEDLYSFIMSYEGHEGYCDDSKTKYVAKDIGDGAVTIGYGITNHVINVNVGDCMDVQTIDNLFMDHIDSLKGQVEADVASANISNWDDAKTDATVSIGYNCGMSYAKKVIQAYASSGNDGALSAFKSCTHASNGNSSMTGALTKRRDGEYELFTTGNYDSGFYEREVKYIK